MSVHRDHNNQGMNSIILKLSTIIVVHIILWHGWLLCIVGYFGSISDVIFLYACSTSLPFLKIRSFQTLTNALKSKTSPGWEPMLPEKIFTNSMYVRILVPHSISARCFFSLKRTSILAYEPTTINSWPVCSPLFMDFSIFLTSVIFLFTLISALRNKCEVRKASPSHCYW